MLCAVRFTFVILISWATINLSCGGEMLNKIENNLENIEKSRENLKNLFIQLVSHTTTTSTSSASITSTVRKEELKEEDCVCVPYYLCDDKGTIIKDGSYIIRQRSGSDNPCSDYNICCEKEKIRDSLKAAPNYKCGYGSELPQNSQIPVTNAKFGEYPWTVVILKNSKYYSCVGSLIHPKVILTAAHCVNATKSYTILAGAWNTSKVNPEHPSQKLKVDRIIKHPEFTSNNLFYDAALLILKDSFNLTKTIKTACLVESTPKKAQFNSCYSSGWGMISLENPFYSRVMKKVELTLLLHNQCESSLRATRLGKWFELHHSFVCAYGLVNELCDGDGGAPLVCKAEAEDNRYEQVGISSWGVSCGSEFPSVFTKISYIKSWIDGQFELLGYDKQYYSL